jgi:hypothetical protein
MKKSIGLVVLVSIGACGTLSYDIPAPAPAYAPVAVQSGNPNEPIVLDGQCALVPGTDAKGRPAGIRGWALSPWASPRDAAIAHQRVMTGSGTFLVLCQHSKWYAQNASRPWGWNVPAERAYMGRMGDLSRQVEVIGKQQKVFLETAQKLGEQASPAPAVADAKAPEAKPAEAPKAPEVKPGKKGKKGAAPAVPEVTTYMPPPPSRRDRIAYAGNVEEIAKVYETTGDPSMAAFVRTNYGKTEADKLPDLKKQLTGE